MAKRRTEKLHPTVESPTWGDVQHLAESVLHHLGGNARAAQLLSERSFYALAILASLNLDEQKANAPIFGKRYLET